MTDSKNWGAASSSHRHLLAPSGAARRRPNVRSADVDAWVAFWNSRAAGKTNLVVLEDGKVSNGVKWLPASHGCFDKAVDIVSEALTHAAKTSVKIKRLDH